MVGRVHSSFHNFSHRQDFPSTLEIPSSLEIPEQDCQYMTKSAGPGLAINDSMIFYVACTVCRENCICIIMAGICRIGDLRTHYQCLKLIISYQKPVPEIGCTARPGSAKRSWCR